MTVLIIAMSPTARHRRLERVLPISLPVTTNAASHIHGVVTLIMTVGTVQMKRIAVSIPIEATNGKLIEFALIGGNIAKSHIHYSGRILFQEANYKQICWRIL